jgi:hypothetical protein
MLAELKATAGTIKEPQNTQSNESSWQETSLVHFPDDKLTPIPAFEESMGAAGSLTLQGTCRAQWAGRLGGTSTISGAYHLFGTHSHLFTEYKAVRYNITPLQTTSTAIANSIATTNTSKTIVFTAAAHGQAIGDRVKISGAAGAGGIPALSINKEHIITAITAGTFSVLTDTAATSNVVAGGGAATVYFKQIAAGNQNQTFLAGYGAGLYGRGLYGTNRFSTAAQSYPRIWSFDNFGNQFIMCAGDYTAGDGQKIYIWGGDRDIAPEPLDNVLFPNAPTDCNWVTVVANQIVALCGTNIIIGLTDPTTGGATFPTVPSTSAFGDIIPVQRSTRLLSAAPFGEKSAIVFAPEPMLLRLVGGIWDLVELGNDYPIASPSAFCKINDGIMRYAQDGNYYFCNGGAVQQIINRQNGEYVRERLNQNAIWTSFMMADQKHGQAWHYYPSTGQNNPDSYVIFNPANKSFTTGNQNRTSAQRPSVIDQRFYMTNDETIYAAFTQGATTFSWSARTAFFFIDPTYRYKLTRLYPDCVITGTISVTIYGREHPQDDDINYGTYTLDADSTVITVRAASRLMAMEFSGTTDFTLAGLKMEVQRMGTRRL